MGMGVSVVVIVVVGMSVGHGQLLYYNITGVHVWAAAPLRSGRHSGMVRGTRPGISRFRVRCFASPWNDVDAASRSRGAYRPRSASSLASSRKRGRREDRVRAAPAVSRALLCKRKRARAYRFSGGIRPSLRNGFTAYFVLFPVNGFLATVASRADPRNLTPAPRRQNHTTSPYATGQPRQSWPPRPPHPTARS